jgi:hypothetical protein
VEEAWWVMPEILAAREAQIGRRQIGGSV